jgi:hypothetical protein
MSKYVVSEIPSEYALVYTENEGSDFSVYTGFTPEQFEELKINKYFIFRTGMIKDARIYPAYAMLVKCIEGFDFVLDQMNTIKDKNVNTFKGALESINRRKEKDAKKIKS